jgi:hypothetical protein
VKLLATSPLEGPRKKIVLITSVSIDGFIEGPNRELDWHMVDGELHSHFTSSCAR